MILQTRVTCPECGNPDLHLVNYLTRAGTQALTIVECPTHGQYSIEALLRLHKRNNKKRTPPTHHNTNQPQHNQPTPTHT